MATRLGLQAKSFDLAAAGFSDAVGRAISGDSMARLTEGWGRRVREERTAEAACANQPGHRGERLAQRRLPEVAAITTQANISTDGAMLLVRQEGWKEVKVVAISEVQTQPASARSAAQPSRRDTDPLVTLTRHSYQAGLWDADTMAEHQYAEGLRRGLDYCPKRSSVNDGALWIKRITATNFPGVPQIVDWSHATGHLWAVANAVHGERTAAAQQWVEPQLDQLGAVKSPKWSPPWISSTCSSPAGPTWSKQRPTTSVPIKSACVTTSSAPEATPSAAARSKAPLTRSSIIACAGLAAAGHAIMVRRCWRA